MLWYILIPILLWIAIMTFLITPSKLYGSAWDRITRAKWRTDRVGLQVMLDHLRSRPEEWSIKRGQAHFPKEGAKQIVLDYDNSKGWSYSLSSFGGDFRPLDGHFAKQFEVALNEENNARETKFLLREFYPNLDGPLMLR